MRPARLKVVKGASLGEPADWEDEGERATRRGRDVLEVLRQRSSGASSPLRSIYASTCAMASLELGEPPSSHRVLPSSALRRRRRVTTPAAAGSGSKRGAGEADASPHRVTAAAPVAQRTWPGCSGWAESLGGRSDRGRVGVPCADAARGCGGHPSLRHRRRAARGHPVARTMKGRPHRDPLTCPPASTQAFRGPRPLKSDWIARFYVTTAHNRRDRRH